MMALAHRWGTGRYVLIQATVLLFVFIVIAVTPAPVTFPQGPWEIVLLLKGAVALLLADLLLVGVARNDVQIGRSRARAMEREIALEWSRIGHYHVVEQEAVVGVVEEVIADRGGTPKGVIVTDGWFGRRRFLVPLDELRSIDGEERTVTVEPQ
jgi:uncharacterized integral membrane protein